MKQYVKFYALALVVLPLNLEAKVRVDEPLPLVFGHSAPEGSLSVNNDESELNEVPEAKLEPTYPDERVENVTQPDFDLQQNLLEIYKYPAPKRGELLLEGARFALRQGKPGHLKAEKMFHEALRYELTPTQTKETLIELAQFYTEKGNDSKTILVYEKYLESFPNDNERPQILFALANLYKRIKAYDMALGKFYEIINLSLAISEHQLPVFRRISTKAQIQIAETYFDKEDYESAVKLYKRLEGLELTSNEEDLVAFKTAYCNFHLKNYETAATQLNELIKKSPSGRYSPEAMYLLAHTLKNQDLLKESVKKVIELINHPLPLNRSMHEEWLMWKRQTANELANEFYENKDYVSALEVYQAMATISEEPQWQWPVIYQIGRCFEYLNILDKAKESYALISEAKEWDLENTELSEALTSLRNTATWRMNNIAWVETKKSNITNILTPVAPDLEANTTAESASRDT